MNLKNLESAAKNFEEIKKLDQQIIEIEKFAMLVANGEIKSSFELKVEDLGKKKEETAKVSFDEDGSLISDEEKNIKAAWIKFFQDRDPFGINRFCGPQANKNDHILKYELSETATMQILGVLLAEKQSARRDIITKLKSFGVEI